MITLTPTIAFAAGRDAGNRSMRMAGRTKWSDEDYNIAAKLTNRLLDMLYGKFPESPNSQQNGR